MKHLFSAILLLCLATGGSAQNILYAPVLGGATDTSVRILFFTSAPVSFRMEVSRDSSFSSADIYTAVTDSRLHNRGLVDVHGLTPDTRYYYRVMIDGRPDERKGSFTTWPAEGTRRHYTITTGSCQETDDMKAYDVMARHKPDVFIHTGDWTYPDYMVPGYPTTEEFIFKGYEKRYTEKSMKEMLPYTLIDYVADNHDGTGMGIHEHLRAARFREDSAKGIINYFDIDSDLCKWRSNVIQGYMHYYPGYPLADTSHGIYHSFRMGNAEFFVLDTRQDAELNVRGFLYDSTANHWTFAPGPQHKIISDTQMQWLKDGLKNSTADWKFIAMGVPFNKNARHLINLGIHYQDLELADQGTGFRMASSWSCYWAGYPASQEDLLGFIRDNNIKDILVISGDTHHNVMDDGRNAGLPEINASGLSVTGTVLAHYMNLIGVISGYPNIKKYLWNGGGNGIHNKNYKNAFGQIDINGRESVRMSFVDEDDHVICALDIPHSSTITKEKKQRKPLYLKRVERISFAKKPTPGIRFIKAMARTFLHKKKIKTNGDLT